MDFLSKSLLNSSRTGTDLQAYSWTRQGNRIGKCGCHVRCTMYDVRFINNVRVAQILFGALTYAEIPLDPSL